MLLLSQTINEHGQAMSPYMAIDQLRALESVMTARGWPVIGSLYKASKLHKWKDVPAAQLHQWAQEDLAQYRANSLNLRLSDHKVIALDCDFNDPELMRAFCDGAESVLSLSPEQIYTCAGKKGGKLFFRFLGGTGRHKPPRLPALTGYTKGHAGDSAYKQELELKTDLSTVAGFHSVTKSGDVVLYTAYSKYPYIVHAKPEDLATITSADIMLLHSLFNRLLIERGFVNAQGGPIKRRAHRDLVRACAASVLSYACRPDKNAQSLALCEYQLHMRPALVSLELFDACEAIEAVAYGAKVYDKRLEHDVSYLSGLYQAGDTKTLERLAGSFDTYLRRLWTKQQVREQI